MLLSLLRCSLIVVLVATIVTRLMNLSLQGKLRALAPVNCKQAWMKGCSKTSPAKKGPKFSHREKTRRTNRKPAKMREKGQAFLSK